MLELQLREGGKTRIPVAEPVHSQCEESHWTETLWERSSRVSELDSIIVTGYTDGPLKFYDEVYKRKAHGKRAKDHVKAVISMDTWEAVNGEGNIGGEEGRIEDSEYMLVSRGGRGGENIVGECRSSGTEHGWSQWLQGK